MSLSAGVRIGAYEVLESLGSGGMGEVYRARDTNLKRDVAIKVLPKTVVADPDRLARFQREAEVLATFNHPHIAQIYGIVRTGDALTLVMELVDGVTLAERIQAETLAAARHGQSAAGSGPHRQGPRAGLPVDEALAIGAQIAEALEAAHEQGIVHRDLKPANIKEKRDGTVKVLDFGLAKALDPADRSASVGLADSPTITTPAMTRAGVILGTAAYMAPEQARGRPVDRRADMWAFGCVMFELLSGQPAFAGDTLTDVLAAVLKTEPELSALPADTPPSVRRLLGRCLTKDPKHRLADASTARLEIEDALRAPREDATASSPSSHRVRERLAWMVAAAMTLAAIAMAMFGARARPSSSNGARPEVRLQMADTLYDEVISPDGTAIVYAARVGGRDQFMVRMLATGATRPLPTMDSAAYDVFWSADGRSIGFHATQKLKRVDIDSGVVRTLADAPTPRGGTWGPDGTILFAPGGNGPIYRIPAAGGTAEALTALDASHVSHRFPVFVPDGRHFLFWVLGPAGVRGEYLGSLDDRSITRLFDADGPAAVAGSDQVLFIREGVLYAQRLDLAARKMSGDPVLLASGFFTNETNAPRVSASRNGILAYRPDAETHWQIEWVDRTGRSLQKIGEPVSNFLTGRLSPDGRSIALSRAQYGGSTIWLMDVARGTLSRFANGTGAVWSPDGSRLAFHSSRDGFTRIYWQSVDNAAPAELLFRSTEAQNVNDWSPDGASIVFSSQSPASARDLWVLPVTNGPRLAKPFLQSPAEERNGAFSPDGSWLAYESNELSQTGDNPRMEISVRPFPGPGRAWRASVTGGQRPFWRRDGRELYYLSPEGLMAVAVIRAGNRLEFGRPTLVWPPGAGHNPLLNASDGARFLVATLDKQVPPPPLTIVINWSSGAQ